MKIIVKTLLCLIFGTITLTSQSLYTYSSGNGYDFEIAVAEQAIDCISKGCFDGLKRTMFIDENTDADEHRIKWEIDSLNNKPYSKLASNYGFRHDAYLPELTFYKTFCLNSEDSVLFQIKLELIYKSGLLTAKSIKFIGKDFVLTPTNHPLRKPVNQGSKTNIPPIPPDLIFEAAIYKARGLNLCSDCIQKKIITVDQNKRFWFKEKYRYEFIEAYGDDLFKVKKNGFWGIINYGNEEIVPIIYDKIDVMNNPHTFMVYKEGKVGVYNEITKIPAIYEELNPYTVYNDGVQSAFIAKRDASYGVLDYRGNVVVPIEYEEITLFYSKYLKLKKGELYGVANVNGDILYKPMYKEIDFEPKLYNGIMKITDMGGRKKLFVIFEENGESVIRKVKTQ